MNELSKPAHVLDGKLVAAPSQASTGSKRGDTSPDAVAARAAAFDRFVREVSVLPILDPRPVQVIIDDLHEV